eukprot:m.56120 g.56120  ORF g.56120 m.56120 type:complete len:587 (-) comp11019_c0_seq1:45-1805(-)
MEMDTNTTVSNPSPQREDGLAHLGRASKRSRTGSGYALTNLNTAARVYDKYGFYRIGRGSGTSQSPVVDIALEKLKDGIITKDEYEHIITMVHPSHSMEETEHPIMLACSFAQQREFHQQAWEQFLKSAAEQNRNQEGHCRESTGFTRENEGKSASKSRHFSWSLPQSLAPSKMEDFGRLVRGGVPDEHRLLVWRFMIDRHVGRDRALAGPSYYATISNVNPNAGFGDSPSKLRAQIEQDLPRTFPANLYFLRDDGEGIVKLRRVLTAFMRHSPGIGYCQGLNFIAGFALIFLPEESAFWCLVALVNHILPSGYYSNKAVTAAADQRVLQDVLARWCPSVHVEFEMHSFDPAIASLHWFLSLFVGCLPTEVTLRLWDLLLFRGDAALFSLAFAIFKMQEKKICRTPSRLDLMSKLLNFTMSDVDTAEIIENIAGKCSIDEAFIRERRTYWIRVLDAEMNASLKSPQRKGAQLFNHEGEEPEEMEYDMQQISPLRSKIRSQELEALMIRTAELCHSHSGPSGITYMRVKRKLMLEFTREAVEYSKSFIQRILLAFEDGVREGGISDANQFDNTIVREALADAGITVS